MSPILAAGLRASSERGTPGRIAFSRARTFMLTALSLLLVVGTAAGARAQAPVTIPQPVAAVGPEPPPLAPVASAVPGAPSPVRTRPRFSAAVSVGASFDRTGLLGPRTEPVPAFQVQLGFGDGFLGFGLGLFATQGSGRYRERAAGGGDSDMGADRLGVDALVVVRPFAGRRTDSLLWIDRTLRTTAMNLGIAAENASVGVPSVLRLGRVAGAHIDLPLSPAAAASSVAFRVTVRKMMAGQREAGAVSIDDTLLELFGGLAVAF